MSYTVTARRWAHGWELHIDNIGVTQAKRLTDAPTAAREYIALALDIDDLDSIDVDIAPEIEGVTELVHEAQDQTRRVAEATRAAADKQRRAVRELANRGITGREIAALMKVSTQRVSQLLAATKPASLRDTAIKTVKGSRRVTKP